MHKTCGRARDAAWLLLAARWVGLVLWLVAGPVVTARAEEPSEAPTFLSQASQADPGSEGPSLELPHWLQRILGETPEAPTYRLPAWFPRLLGAQATAIDQGVLPFHSPYQGVNSLTSHGDEEITDTYGLYLGSQLTTRLQFYFDLELFKGNGISKATGVGGLTNGDVIRQGTIQLAKSPYVARAYFRYVLPLSPETEPAPRGMDQIPGLEPTHRLEVKFGRFATNDDFDLNRYAGSARTQFLNWSLWDDTAWDYAADTRGFSYGFMVAWVNPTWIFRVGSMMMPTFANGNTMDEHIWNARGDQVELTLRPSGWGTVVRLLGYVNEARMGIYRDAIEKAEQTGTTPDITRDDHPGRIKWGFGLNLEQPLADQGETGLFARLGWDDGKTETFAFTEVDRHASFGAQLSGVHWWRPEDRVGLAYVFDGLAPDHRHYLERGGAGFVLGDGKLNYALEQIAEVYYRYQLFRYVQTSLDYQFIQNPGNNRDRGPAHVIAGRIHVTF